MTAIPPTAALDVAEPVPAPVSERDLRPALRFLTCGSVDDGKSTLIGRLLYEQNSIFDDQLSALERDSRKHGTAGEDIDFALLVDGLEAEREQGITIDVAYRYFSTPRRAFVVADTPGHEQFTRNMATGASNADLAILLVDARKGLLTQTRRHAFIVSLLGIRQVVLAVNKIDLMNYDEAVFTEIDAAFRLFARDLGFADIKAIPLSARFGDNLSSVSANMPWYTGGTLLDHLETVEIADARGNQPFRMPVQWVNRPNLDFRGFCGTVASGRIAVGDEVVIAGSGRATKVARIVTADGDWPHAEHGEAVTLTLADEIDIARGDIIAEPKARPQVGDQFSAHLIWMSDEAMRPGRSYFMKLATRTVPATVTSLVHRLDINSLGKDEASTLRLNEVGLANLSLNVPVSFDPYAENRATGAFVLIDRETNQTVAAGMIAENLRRATNVFRQEASVERGDRVRLKHHKPAVLWFTGLSGAGKSTIANRVESRLNAAGVHTVLLDGDNIRHGLNKDLGFSEAERLENIRRVAEVARLMIDAGLVVLCSFISPFRAEREMARALVLEGEFIEVFVDTPLDVCQQRDVKGLYKRALAGEIKNFTGVDQAYERPEQPEVTVGHEGEAVDLAAARVIEALVSRHIVQMFDGLID